MIPDTPNVLRYLDDMFVTFDCINGLNLLFSDHNIYFYEHINVSTNLSFCHTLLMVNALIQKSQTGI